MAAPVINLVGPASESGLKNVAMTLDKFRSTTTPAPTWEITLPEGYDKDIEDVILLLHLDATPPVDSSKHHVTVTPGGMTPPTYDTAQKKMGLASGHFNGNSAGYNQSHLTCAGIIENGMKLLDWTIEFWIRPTQLSITAGGQGGKTIVLCKQGEPATSTPPVMVQMFNGKIGLWGNATTAYVENPTPFVHDTWYYVAIVRVAKVFYLYVDGKLVHTATVATVFDYGHNAFPWTVGSLWLNGNQFEGHLDEVRITTKARYTGPGMDVPTIPFPSYGDPPPLGAIGLPPGLTMDATTGIISGTPTTPGVYPVKVTARNADGKASVDITITITAPDVNPVITKPADQTITATVPFTLPVQGLRITTWSATGLPPGLVIDAGTGVISGTPTTVGDYTVVVTGTNAAGTTSATFKIHVEAKVVSPVYTWPYTISSTDDRIDPREISTSRGGSPRLRLMYNRPRRGFKIESRGITNEVRAQITAFLDANRAGFEIDWPCKGGTPMKVFLVSDRITWSKSQGLWEMSFELIEDN